MTIFEHYQARYEAAQEEEYTIAEFLEIRRVRPFQFGKLACLNQWFCVHSKKVFLRCVNAQPQMACLCDRQYRAYVKMINLPMPAPQSDS